MRHYPLQLIALFQLNVPYPGDTLVVVKVWRIGYKRMTKGKGVGGIFISDSERKVRRGEHNFISDREKGGSEKSKREEERKVDENVCHLGASGLRIHEPNKTSLLFRHNVRFFLKFHQLPLFKFRYTSFSQQNWLC